MSLANIRDQVKSILSGVSGIGEVHDYQRWAPEWKKFLELFKGSDDKINGWIITRTKTSATCESTTHDSRVHHFLIRGYYGLKDEDETELTFQALVESICSEFRSKYQLNGTAEDTGPMQVELVEPRVFGAVLCHYCELSLTAEEFEDWS